MASPAGSTYHLISCADVSGSEPKVTTKTGVYILLLSHASNNMERSIHATILAVLHSDRVAAVS